MSGSCHGTVKYLYCGKDYKKLHRWKTCKRCVCTCIKACITGWIRLISISLFWYTVLMQDTNIEWGWVNGAWYLPVYFLESSWYSMIISRSKVLKQKLSSQVTFMQPLDCPDWHLGTPV